MADTVDLAGAQRVLSDMGPSIADELDAAQEAHLADLVRLGQAEAMGRGGAAVYVGPTIRPDGLGNLTVGGQGVTSGGGTVGDVLLGTMFGSDVYPQFPGRNVGGYYLTSHIDELAEGRGTWGQRDSEALREGIRKAG